MGATRDIAEFAIKAQFEDFDTDTVKHVKNVLLSGVGMTVAGVSTDIGKNILSYVKACGAPEEVGVLGAGFRTSVEYATLANGTTSHGTELEDDTREPSYSVGMFPGILALGEKLRVSGKEVIEAFVVGWDVASKLGLASPDMLRRGFANFSAFSTIGVAACSARMLKLDVEKTTMAVSIAASQASGLFKQVGSGTHIVEAGVAGRNGVASATLAKLGITGQPDILEIPRGYLDAVAGITGPHLKLGAPYRAKDIEFKKYPCCFSQMHPIDSFVELVETHDICATNVDRVQIDVPPSFTLAAALYHHPRDEEEARFSLAHSIACCFLDRKPWLESYTSQRANDPEVKEFRDRVEIVVRPELAGAELPIRVKLKDGTEYKKTTRKLSDPLIVSDAEILEKYMRCALAVFSQSRAEQIAETVLSLEKVRDISEVLALLTFPDKP